MDIEKDYARLTHPDVAIGTKPAQMLSSKPAIFDDAGSNNIWQIQLMRCCCITILLNPVASLIAHLNPWP